MQLTTVRFQAGALVLLAAAVVALLHVGPPPDGDRPLAASVVPAVARPSDGDPRIRRPVVRALDVLRRWDRHRSSAYRRGDVQALRALYTPASHAGARDVAVLRRYLDRGLVVEGLRFQRRRAELLTSAPGVLRLRLVERMSGGQVAVGGTEKALPGTRSRVRTVSLVRLGGRWVVRGVRPGEAGGVTSAPP